MSAYREYENGVADVLRFLVGDTGTVELDVHVPGRRSGRSRQVDVLVTGAIFGLSSATLVADCKRWNSKLNVTHAEAFLAYLDDAGADLGLLVTTHGYSSAAKRRVLDARGVRAEVLTLAELQQWAPRGTAHVTYRLPATQGADARAALIEAGLRVRDSTGFSCEPDEIVIEAHRIQGAGGEPTLVDVTAAALATKRIATTPIASGTTIDGGTPAHKWLEVTDTEGTQLGLKILASNEQEIDANLQRIAPHLDATREQLDVIRPDDWPVVGLFGLPS